MIRCGELCASCGSNKCIRDREESPALIACPACNELGCDQCKDGYFELSQCPREAVGYEVSEAVNIAAMCGNGDWPLPGGLFEQSAWFVDLKRTIDSEQGRIESERISRASK